MASIKNSPNDVLRKFYEYPKSNEKGVKSTSPKKGEVKANQNFKSVSFTKASIKPSSNIKITQSKQGMQNNININVNNLIINNTSTPNCKATSIYPSNYETYLVNSSLFSNLGKSIMGVKTTIGHSETLLRKQMSQPRLNMKTKQKINNTTEVTKVTVNNVYNNNFDSDFNKLNLNEAPGVANFTKKDGGNSFSDDIGSENYKSTSCVLNNSMMNHVINNILDLNKNNINSTATKFHIKKNVSYKSFSNKALSNKGKAKEENKVAELSYVKDSLDVKANNEMNLKESENNLEILIVVSDEILKSHAAIWELMLDLENSTDTKPYLSLFSNKLLKQLEDEILYNQLTFDLFSNSILNKTYTKIIKIASIMIVFLKHITLDYNYEISMRNNTKKFIGSINEHLLNFVENYVFSRDSQEKKFSKEFIEKHTKLLKQHKIKRSTKEIAFNCLTNGFIFKNLESAVNSVKLFSSNFFKIGYFKPLHTICYDIFRTIDNFSIVNVITILTKYILFYLIHAESAIRERLANTTTSSKQMALSSVFIGMGMGGNVSAPFLPEVDPNTYCLVLDLDETLVHFFFTPSGGTFLVRPGAHEFLKEMSELYEIVIFTAAMKDYADNILDKLDKNKTLIKHRLYRHHTSITNMGVVKDLSKLGRNLAKAIIIDNIAENFKLQPNNGLFIKTWNDDMRDTQLYDFGKILKDIRTMNVPDVRNVIKIVKEEVSKKVKKNSANPYANIDISKLI